MSSLVPFTIVVVCLVYLFYIWRVEGSRKSIYRKIGISAIIICSSLCLVKVIDFNVAMLEAESKISKVVDVCGDTYVRMNRNTPQIKVKGKWVDLEDVSVIGKITAAPIILTYNGEEIYLGESGIVNTIKTLDAVGLISNED